jgi:6-phospho-beta-glucosidase
MKNNKLKIVTIGGGSSYTPEFIEGFIQRSQELPVGEICLVDLPSGQAKLETVTALAQRMVNQAGCDITISCTVNRQEALVDADFVTTQFRVGGLEARIRDERIPLKYGCIGQETTGPGGFANALRTIPVILDICRDIEECCPDAWLINFTNPSGIITETILNHSKVKAIGLCNCPIGVQNDVAEAYNCSADDVYCDFIGLNHLLWAQKILVNDQDVTAEVISHAHENDEIMANIPDVAISARFYKSLGLLPISYLKYYYLTKEMFEECLYDSEHEGVRGEVVKAVESELFHLYDDPNLNIKPPQLSERGGAHYSDAACNLINSIYNSKGDIQVVNVKNNGCNSDLPDDAVIERNCVIDSEGAHPLPLGPMPLKIRGLVQIVKAYEQLTIQAGVFGDRDAALQALTLHPLVNSSVVAGQMLDELISANQSFLSQFK